MVAPGQENPNYSLRGVSEKANPGDGAGDGNASEKEGGGYGDWEDVVNQVDDSNELPVEHKVQGENEQPMGEAMEQPTDQMGNSNDGEKYNEGEEVEKGGEERQKEFRKEEFNSNKECLTC